MNNLAYRRIRNAVLASLLLAGAFAWLRWDEMRLGRSAISSGYLLGGLVLGLAAYNLRKKLPSLPLGSSSAWLQVHCYGAIVAAGVFLWHTGFRWPNGILESTLWASFVATFASGLWGLYLTRTVPGQLSRVGKEVTYEQIADHRRRTAADARSVVLKAVDESGQSTLADFFVTKLYDYFARERSLAYLLIPSTSQRRRLSCELGGLDRYLSHPEREASEQLFRLVRQKDDLDFHHARQGLLKWWLFAHLTLTVALLALGITHTVVVLAWRGGAL